MDVQKLLIADCNEDFREAAAARLAGSYQVFTCGDGKTALEILYREHCGLVIMDMVLPELDGIGFLTAAMNAGFYPIVMVVSSFVNSYVEDMVKKLNVAYLMRKPASLDAVAERLTELNTPVHPLLPDARTYLSDLLRSLHLSPKHHGFNYLREAIQLRLQNPSDPVTKVLYPAVAEIFGCTGRQVERSIRSALSAAWSHQEDGVWLRYFPAWTKRPSNAAFISRMAEELYAAQSAGIIRSGE